VELIGFFLLRTPISNWLGWMFILTSSLLFILKVIFKDMPPFAYYIFTLVLSISLLSGPGRRAERINPDTQPTMDPLKMKAKVTGGISG
jgi:hypothetical protein